MEDVLAGIKAYFESDLEAMLGIIETERGATIPLWKNLETARIKDRQYPAIEIVPATGAIEYEYGEEDGPFIQPTEYHSVNATVSQVGSEYEEVQNDLLRYVEGIRRITIDDDTYGDRFLWVRLNGVNMDEIPSAQKSGKLLQKVVVTFRVKIIRG